jgi:hypothetical protein
MADITITLTDTQLLCLDRITQDKVQWLTNAGIARAYTESVEIKQALMAYCNANSIAMAVGEDAQIRQAYEIGAVLTAEDQAKADERD